MKTKLLLLLLAVLCISCSEQHQVKLYVDFLKNPENGLIRNWKQGALHAQLQYKPAQYMALTELGGEAVDDEQRFEERVNNYENMHHLVLKMGVTEPGANIINYRADSDQVIQERIYYLSYHLQKDIYLVDGPDTLPCLLYHFERAYDITPQRTFSLAFEKKSTGKDKQLVIDSPLFNHQQVSFNLHQEDLDQIPILNL